jgi:hypothetical protein
MFLKNNPPRTKPERSIVTVVVRLVIASVTALLKLFTPTFGVGIVSRKAIDSVSARSHGTRLGSNVYTVASGVIHKQSVHITFRRALAN